jgi:hypothetical protein
MQPGQWQQIIWREWRHCTDLEYEERLFRIVAGEPVGWTGHVSIIVLNSIAGAALALLAGFVITINWTILANLLWAGALVGGAVGVFAGRRLTWEVWLARLQANTPAGDWGRLIVGTLSLLLIGTLFFGPLAWLVIFGLFWSFGGLIHWINSATSEDELYRSPDRRWWYWWRGQPHLFTVEDALRQAVAQSPAGAELWAAPLRQLEERKSKLPPPAELIQNLLHNDWRERFAARYQLVLWGNAARPELEAIANSDASPLRDTAEWLLHNISTQPPAAAPHNWPAGG